MGTWVLINEIWYKTKKKVERKKPGPIKPGQHLLLKPQVLELCGGVAYPTIWHWMKDADFPRPIALGPVAGRSTRVAWIAAEVYAWIAMRPRRPIGELQGNQDRPGRTFEASKGGGALR